MRTVASHRGYYERWAKTWEFQALLKARAVAGDLELGREFVEMTRPMVWCAAERDGFVADTQAMRRRVVDHIPAREAERQLKLGAGGLRDVEFAVQLLQLVHGRADERIRPPTTLSALAELTRGGYVGREDGEALHEAYGFLRTLEHRIQLHRLRRTHVVPEDEASLRRIGRSMNYLKDPVGILDKTWQHHRREVRRLHEKLFYRPLLTAVARIPGDEARLSPEAAEQRLAALGFADSRSALRHLESLTAGVTRTAQIQRTLLPAMLAWFADAPDPDAGLFGFRRISESLGATPWYLSTLRDEGQVAERLARILATSRYATDLLEREPQGVRMLAGDLQPLAAEALTEEMLSSSRRQTEPEAATKAIRGIRRRELLRIACGDLLGVIDVADVGAGLSRLTDATLEATLDVAGRAVRRQRDLDEAPTRMAIVAMGRYGGFELSYGSDADVMFVHEPVEGADPQAASSYAQAVANELRRLLALPGPDPALEVDADLRPEGKQGALVRTLESYAAYYAKWSKVWEAQALLRADAVVGDLGLRERFEEMIEPLRYPPDGISEDDIVEVLRIKARDRRRAAAAGRRPAHPPQARPRRPRRHRVDRPAAADAVRRAGARPAHLTHPRGAGRGPGGRPDRRGRRGRAAAELASGQPGPQRRDPGPRPARRRAAPRHPRARGGRLHARLPGRFLRRDGQRPAPLHPPRARRRGPRLLGLRTSHRRPCGSLEQTPGLCAGDA